MHHVPVVSMPAERKHFFRTSVFFLLESHYGHFYRVEEAQSRNKRSLCSHASCASCIDTCRKKNLFLIGASRSCCQYVLCLMEEGAVAVQKKCKHRPNYLAVQFLFVLYFTKKMLGAQEDTLMRICSTGVGDDCECE
jgi:hypothetical protein